jgi:hypothetical protein
MWYTWHCWSFAFIWSRDGFRTRCKSGTLHSEPILFRQTIIRYSKSCTLYMTSCNCTNIATFLHWPLPAQMFSIRYIFIHSSKVCPLYSGFPSPKTKFRHLSLSLVSSSLSPWFIMLRLTPSIHHSLGLPLLRVPSGSHSKTFSGSLFPGILFTFKLQLSLCKICCVYLT